MQSILIIGSGGFIGSAITERMQKEAGWMNLFFGTSSSGRFGLLALDVTDENSVASLQQWLVKNEVRLRAIVYAVGSCKKGGFREELTTDRQDIDLESYKKKSELFGLGLMRVMTGLLPSMDDNGHIVVISSATRETKPPYYLSNRLYGAAISAQEVLISAMQEDQEMLGKRNIKVHRIAPGAVAESPFYEGVPKEFLPRHMVSVKEVAEAVVQAINMPTGHMDTNFFADATSE